MKTFMYACLALCLFISFSCKKSKSNVYELYMQDSIRVWVPEVKMDSLWKFVNKTGKEIWYRATEPTYHHRYLVDLKVAREGFPAGSQVSGDWGRASFINASAPPGSYGSLSYKFGNYLTDAGPAMFNLQNVTREASITIYSNEFNNHENFVFSTNRQTSYQWETFNTPVRNYTEVIKIVSPLDFTLSVDGFERYIHEMWFDKKFGLVYFKYLNGQEFTRIN